MSSNRLIYDGCAYKQRLTESTNPLAYQLNILKFESCNKCRHELGIIGGSNVSEPLSQLVDLESDLRGQTRILSNCPEKKYPDKKLNDNRQKLPACQMIRYKPLPLPKPVVVDICSNNC